MFFSSDLNACIIPVGVALSVKLVSLACRDVQE
jgi:hypothetical protein